MSSHSLPFSEFRIRINTKGIHIHFHTSYTSFPALWRQQVLERNTVCLVCPNLVLWPLATPKNEGKSPRSLKDTHVLVSPAAGKLNQTRPNPTTNKHTKSVSQIFSILGYE